MEVKRDSSGRFLNEGEFLKWRKEQLAYTVRVCVACGNKYVPTQFNQRYCSYRCSNRTYLRTWNKRRKGTIIYAKCMWCKVTFPTQWKGAHTFITNRFCSLKCWKEWKKYQRLGKVKTLECLCDRCGKTFELSKLKKGHIARHYCPGLCYKLALHASGYNRREEGRKYREKKKLEDTAIDWLQKVSGRDDEEYSSFIPWV